MIQRQKINCNYIRYTYELSKNSPILTNVAFRREYLDPKFSLRLIALIQRTNVHVGYIHNTIPIDEWMLSFLTAPHIKAVTWTHTHSIYVQ